MSYQDRPKPALKSTVTELPRIVDLVNKHEHPKPAVGRAELPAPEPALSFDGQFDLRGVSKVRVDARSPLAVVAVVLIVLIIVTGSVLGARSGGPREQQPSRELRPCIERIKRTEVIERTCAHDGS